MNIKTHKVDYATDTSMSIEKQIRYHAFTLNPMYPRKTRKLAYKMVVNAKNYHDIGIACHYLGDSFSHTAPSTGKTFKFGVGHILNLDFNEGIDVANHHIDRISYRPELYLKYVNFLGSALSHGKPSGQVTDLSKQFVFQYITHNSCSYEQNISIMEFQYTIMTTKSGSSFYISNNDVIKYAKALQLSQVLGNGKKEFEIKQTVTWLDIRNF